MVDYPHTKYGYSGFALTDVSNVVVKVYPPLQRIETIRIAVSTVMDGWLAILFRRQDLLN